MFQYRQNSIKWSPGLWCRTSNAELRKVLENPHPKVQLQIANSLWARKGLPFKLDFIKRNTDWYGAQVSDLDFGDSSSAGRINDWVSAK
jgi:serine protease inhibitor